MSRVPNDLHYTEEHEWVDLEGEIATIGITHHAQDQLGDVVFVDLPEVGVKFKQLEDFAVVESVKAASDIYAPMGGKVIEVNEELVEAPDLINKDPYGDGWLCRLRIDNPSEVENLLSAEDYKNHIEQG